MNIDNLTIGQAKELAALFSGAQSQTQPQQPSLNSHPGACGSCDH